MRWSFSATFSGVPALSILVKRTLISSPANSRTSACVNLGKTKVRKGGRASRIRWHSQKLIALFNRESTIDSDGGISIGNIIFRRKVIDKEGEDRKELWFCELP